MAGTVLAHRELPGPPFSWPLSPPPPRQPSGQSRAGGLWDVGDVQGPGPVPGYPGHPESRLAVLVGPGQDGERPKPMFAEHRKPRSREKQDGKPEDGELSGGHQPLIILVLG